MSQPFTCRECGSEFELPPAVLARYPNWTPSTCLRCRDAAGNGKRARPRPAPAPDARAAEETGVDLDDPRLLRVLERYQDGPQDGVFTDGSASPNPGHGGWAAVWVEDGVILSQQSGEEADTTNNRMELKAIIGAFALVPEGRTLTIYSDSQLCVKTVNEWATGWERRGWKRKAGPIKNLDLVQELHARAKARPELTVAWVPGHAGWRWNEYADALCTVRGRG